MARKAGAYGMTVATGIPHPDTLSDLYAAATSVVKTGAEAISVDSLKSVVDSAGAYLKDAEAESTPQQMHEFRQEFETLLEVADIDRLVVLVDDLDRCLPETAIGTLEAIRLFLFVPRAAFVIAADEGMIEYCVRQHFPDLPTATGPATYARNYLEKLIQVPFRLPSLGYTETRIYVALLLVLNECGDDSDTFKKLVPIARAALQKPWIGPGLDRTSLKVAFETIPDAVERALDIAYRIAPILTDGSRGNPRQVKRFINTMALRLAIAEERGFADELNMSVLAKVMLAERFAPEVFDALARGAADTGFSDELIALESHAASDGTETVPVKANRKASSAKKAPKAKEPFQLPDWPNIEWAKRWAGIPPTLAEVDLRPYVFVSRDRRGGYGSQTPLGELDEMLGKLMGPPLQVKQITTEIKRLTSVEAEQLFDALRAKVADAEDLVEEPDGMHGLAAICQHHPFLQASLVGFFRDLPVTKVGTWVMTGWAGAITEAEAKAAYDALKSDWAEQSDNPALSAAAKAAASMGRKRGER
ncbi:Qat anti-phage system ATPase QatA [Marinibacterium profundimaris]